MSPLASYRADKGLTLEQLAVTLGLSAKSRGWLSEIERGVTDASLRLALRIERWSEGKVPAGSVCAELRDDHGGGSGVDDPAVVAPPRAPGAGAEPEKVQ